jgi:hypothetical protein
LRAKAAAIMERSRKDLHAYHEATNFIQEEQKNIEELFKKMDDNMVTRS